MKPLVFINGAWKDASGPSLSTLSHGFMYANSVFDGARAFNGWIPDLDLHCERVIRSALTLRFTPRISAQELVSLAIDGISQFPDGSELYIRPAFHGGHGFERNLDTPETHLVMDIVPVPMPPENGKGLSVCLSSYLRPDPRTAPTTAKASALYPLAKLALAEASEKGFDTGLMTGLDGQVMELATANVWCAKDGVVYTPAPHPSYLNGITRQRMVKLFTAAGVKVVEKRLELNDFIRADEVFATGNIYKLMWINRIEDTTFAKGEFYQLGRKLYWDFASTQSISHYRASLSNVA